MRIFLYFDDLLVQRRYERLVYDTPAFLSTLGGSLGLYLGLSLLGILYGAVDAGRGTFKWK